MRTAYSKSTNRLFVPLYVVLFCLICFMRSFNSIAFCNNRDVTLDIAFASSGDVIRVT